MADISNMEDYLDVRDIIERYEELEAGIEEDDSRDESEESDAPVYGEDERAEFKLLGDLLAELKGNGGDHQWNGDWYPVSLIRDSYFNQAMDELLEDIGDLPKDIPAYLKIEVDYDALQMDYTSVEYEGITYWYR
jgi:hypothetical protein